MSSSLNQIYEFGSFTLDLVRRQLKNRSELVPLNSKAFELLLVLIEENGQVVEKEELMKRLWPDSFVEEGNLSVQVSTLRKALGESPNDRRYIITVPGRGYCFVEPVRTVYRTSETLTQDQENKRERSGSKFWIGVVIVLLLAGGVAVWFSFFRVTHKAPSASLKVIPVTSFPGNEVHPTFSPDGSQLAYAWNGENGDNFDIYVQLIGSGGTALRLTRDPAQDSSPAWSPDGNYIAFVRRSDSGAGIFWIPALGGHESKLGDSHLTDFWGPYLAWTPDGRSLVVVDKESPDEFYGLFILSIETRERRRLTSPDPKLGDDRVPAVSPDGKIVAFSRGSDVYLIPFSGGEVRRLTFHDNAIQGLAWSPDGQEIIFSSTDCPVGGVGALWRIGISGGRGQPLRGLGENIRFLSWSRQRNRLAFSRWVTDPNIWQLDGLGEASNRDQLMRPLIVSTRKDESPQYSPDGKKILFISDRSGRFEFWVCDAEGHNAYPLASDGRVGAASWSPDGQQIAFDSRDQAKYHIYVVSSEGGMPLRLTEDHSDHIMPSWSHDGQWIYFGSNQSDDWQVWKVPSAGGSTVQMTRKGGVTALESHDGRFLYYSKGATSTPPGFWRMSVEGSGEVPIIKLAKEPLPGYWTVTDKGIYFVDDRSERFGLLIPVLKFMNFSTNRTREIMRLEKPPVGGAGLSVSPDGRWLLYQDDDQPSDIMLVEDFR